MHKTQMHKSLHVAHGCQLTPLTTSPSRRHMFLSPAGGVGSVVDGAGFVTGLAAGSIAGVASAHYLVVPSYAASTRPLQLAILLTLVLSGCFMKEHNLAYLV